MKAILESEDGAYGIVMSSGAYAYPDATDDYDAAWHRNSVTAYTPERAFGFSEIMLDSLFVEAIIPQLEAMLNADTRHVRFEPTEPYICLDITRQGEAVDVSTHAEHPLGEEAETFDFSFATSVQKLEHFIEGLHAIKTAFPARG